MVDRRLRISELPEELTPAPIDNLAIDGPSARRTTAKALADATRPYSTELQAREGRDDASAMTPLRVSQAIETLGSQRFATALTGNSAPIYASAAVMAQLHVPENIDAVRVNGEEAVGDGGAALYKKIAVEPEHNGKFRSLDGAWWEKISQTVHLDVARSVISVAPEVDVTASAGDPTVTPTGEVNYFNSVFACGSVLHASKRMVRRSSAFGHAIGEMAQDWERVEAFGNGAMRFAKLASRVTAIGTLSLQWLGNDDPGNCCHDFWLQGGKTPRDTDWDAYGLETRNPGARTAILATEYATAKDQVEGNVGVGRNSLLHLVAGKCNTAIGYNAAAHAWTSVRCVYVGYGAGRDNLFGEALSALGTEAGLNHQQGNNDTLVGVAAGRDIVRGGNNTIIGGNAGRNVTDAFGNVFIGYGAGQNLETGTTVNDRLAIQNSANAAPLIYGTFTSRILAFGNAAPANARGQFTFVTNATDGSANASADDLVVMNNGHAGMTILTPDDSIGQIAFADASDNNIGGIRYDHGTDRMHLYAGDAAQISIGAGGYLAVQNLPNSQPPAGSKRFWYDPSDDNRVKFAP